MTKIILSDERDKTVNLLVRMTTKGAKPDEIYMAIKHSLTVMDAENQYYGVCEESYRENEIAELDAKYHD